MHKDSGVARHNLCRIVSLTCILLSGRDSRSFPDTSLLEDICSTDDDNHGSLFFTFLQPCVDNIFAFDTVMVNSIHFSRMVNMQTLHVALCTLPVRIRDRGPIRTCDRWDNVEVHHLYKIGDSGAVKGYPGDQPSAKGKYAAPKFFMGGLPHTAGEIQRGQAGTSITGWTRRWWGMQSVLVQQAVMRARPLLLIKQDAQSCGSARASAHVAAKAS